MEFVTLKELKEWQNESPDTRHVEVTIKPHSRVLVWVYDDKFDGGQFIKTISDIDLKGVKKKRELEKLKYLKNKYERDD